MPIPIIDFHREGIGDTVVAAWIITSARNAGHRVLLNPRSRRDLATMLSLSEHELTDQVAGDFYQVEHAGCHFEYARSLNGTTTRFEMWSEAIGLKGLQPVRPHYVESAIDGDWAEEQWLTIDRPNGGPRIALFPSAAWPVRRWPTAYFMDLAAELQKRGCAVGAMAEIIEEVSILPCHWWWGWRLPAVAAFMRRADLVIANDSGPAHLAGTIGIPTITICGPTNGEILYGHDPNVTCVSLSRSILSCSRCHFSEAVGYRPSCWIGGCQALMRLPPDTILQSVLHGVPHRSKVNATEDFGGRRKLEDLNAIGLPP